MALDTAIKRRRAAAVPFPWGKAPAPTGTVNALYRSHIAGHYYQSTLILDGGYRLSRFLDPTKYVDAMDGGDLTYDMVFKSRVLSVGPYSFSRGTLQQLVVYLTYNDTDDFVITLTSDNGRIIAADADVEITRVSGMAANATFREFINLFPKHDMWGQEFDVLFSKQIPSDGNVEVTGIELYVLPVENEDPFPEHTSGANANTGSTEFVIEADAVPEVNAY